jgi:iron complex outermembrane receptor protein
MLTEKIMARSLRLVFSGSALAAGLGFAGHAMAQTQDTQQAPIARVEVTGSAIKRIDAETAVPVTIIRAEDLRKEGITTIEQVMANLSVSQSSTGTSQSVGASTGGAAFADLRGIGANKTLVLLNGRRLSNNAYDSSAPDLNMIPFAALERVEVLRDGASSLYGSDAVGGVINFITKKDMQGGSVTFGEDSPQHKGGRGINANAAYGWGSLDTQGYNISVIVDHQEQNAVGGLDRPFNTRYAGGLSSSTSPANWTNAAGVSVNPAASSPNCSSGTNLISNGGTGCQMTTSSFVDYIPRNVRDSGLIRGTFKINDNHELGVEYLTSQSKVSTTIAPVPYGALSMNSIRPDGSANPYFPAEATAEGLDSINLKWRDLPNGARQDTSVNRQQRLVVSLQGNLGAWDYNGALTWNENKVRDELYGYSNGTIITQGVRDGVINPFGAQSAAGTALLNSAALTGTLQNARGQTTGADFHASRELGDWLHAGRNVGLALGADTSYEQFTSAANTAFATLVQASTGIDPNTFNSGSRHTYALYGELNVPIIQSLDVTASLRADKYSDVGTSTNPKVSFRWQPMQSLLVRGSASSGFRAPSLYELHSAQAYTNTGGTFDDPVTCRGGVPSAGHSAANNCGQQFQALLGGNTALQPEKSRNASLGFVFEPVKDLTLGVDFWAIKLDHMIGSLSQDDIFADPTKYASLYHRNAVGELATDGSSCPNPTTCGYIDDRTQNLGKLLTNGIDLSANYRLRTAGYGNFTFASNTTYVHKYDYQNEQDGAYYQNVNIYSGTGNIFRWQSTNNLVWALKEYSVGVTGHYKSGYLDEDSGYGPADHHVASYTTFDLYGSWAQKKGLMLTVGVKNLFDRDPPLSYQDAQFQAGYDPRYADPIGRTYYARVGYNF